MYTLDQCFSWPGRPGSLSRATKIVFNSVTDFIDATTTTKILVKELSVNGNKLEPDNWTDGIITVNVNRGCTDDGNMDPNVWAEIYDPGNPENYPGIPACIDEDNNGIYDVNEPSMIVHIDDGSCAYEVDCAGTCGGYLEPDCCGVCDGDNSQCSNCCGMPFSDNCSEARYEDFCGVCDDIPENE